MHITNKGGMGPFNLIQSNNGSPQQQGSAPYRFPQQGVNAFPTVGLAPQGSAPQDFSFLTTQNGLSPDTLNDLSRKATGHGRSPQDVFTAVQMQHASLIQNGFFTPFSRPEDPSANPHNQDKKDSLTKDLEEGVETFGKLVNGMGNAMGTMLDTGVSVTKKLLEATGELDAVVGSSNPAISDSAIEGSSRMLPSTHPRQKRGAIRMGDEGEYDSDSSCSSASSENRPAIQKGFTSGTHEYDRGSPNRPNTVFEERVTEEYSRSSNQPQQDHLSAKRIGEGFIKTIGHVGEKLVQKVGKVVTDALNNPDPVTEIMKQKDSCRKKVMIGAAVGIASLLFLTLSVTQQTGKFTFIESLPSKANLAITIASGLIIALAIAFVAYYKSKENDCDTQLSHIKGVQSCSRLGKFA